MGRLDCRGMGLPLHRLYRQCRWDGTGALCISPYHQTAPSVTGMRVRHSNGRFPTTASTGSTAARSEAVDREPSRPSAQRMRRHSAEEADWIDWTEPPCVERTDAWGPTVEMNRVRLITWRSSAEPSVAQTVVAPRLSGVPLRDTPLANRARSVSETPFRYLT